jgi:YD repeat-containing protein
MTTETQLITRPVAELFGRHPHYGFAGNGVSAATGNYTETDVDLTFPDGLLGLLTWTRTYNALSTASGPLGQGWTSAFAASLVPSRQSLLLQASGPVEFHDEDGRVLIFTPNIAGGFDPPQDLRANLTWNPDGTFTLSFVSGETWAFDANGRLTGRSREGQTVILDYDAQGVLQQAAHSSGRNLAFYHDGSGRLVQVEASDGRAVSYTHADDGALSMVTVPGGGIFRYETGPGGRLALVTDPDGNLVVANSYDGSGRVQHQDFPGGGSADFAYDATGTTTVTKMPSGARLVFQADADGRMTCLTDPAGNEATFSYDTNGNLAQAVSPGGTVLVQSYDARAGTSCPAPTAGRRRPGAMTAPTG